MLFVGKTILGKDNTELKKDQTGSVKIYKIKCFSLGIINQITFSQYEKNRSQTNSKNTHGQYNMRWTYDLHIQTIGIVPPVIKGCRREHGNGAPNTYPAGQGTFKSPKFYIMLVFIRIKKGLLKNYPGTSESTKDASKIYHHMRRIPESIPTNGFMPGNIPFNTNSNCSSRRQYQYTITGY